MCSAWMMISAISFRFTAIIIRPPFSKVFSDIINSISVERTQLLCQLCLWDSWKKKGIFKLSWAFAATQLGTFFRSLQQWTCCQHSNELLLSNSCRADQLNQYCTLKWWDTLIQVGWISAMRMIDRNLADKSLSLRMHQKLPWKTAFSVFSSGYCLSF